mgnify:CR=1 FL=1
MMSSDISGEEGGGVYVSFVKYVITQQYVWDKLKLHLILSVYM